ncbi:MAG TPA: circadian clock KaiB family protein [Burkholderiales bacterium]
MSAEPLRFSFVLYVAGAGARSLRAIQNAKAACEELLAGRYDLEIVDIYKHPERARDDQIVAVPTLERKRPVPLRYLIGDLSVRERLVESMGMAA